MRQLHPEVHDEELPALYAHLEIPTRPDRPHVYLDMVASVDGAATIRGRTADLGGAADQLAFSRLRETCDAILVGAGTVREEEYGPPRPKAESRDRRQARGLAPVPTLVVVSASLAFDLGSRLFEDPDHHPTILTVEDADPARIEAFRGRAHVVQAGRGTVDLAQALRQLRGRGVARLLCEGGPTLNGQLFAEDLVDELFLTIAPTLVAGDAQRIVKGAMEAPRAVRLVELREHDHELLLRYAVVADRDATLGPDTEARR